ncbi:MAG: hypothetical protein ACLFTI_08020 [Anaerolineales bacterium]
MSREDSEQIKNTIEEELNEDIDYSDISPLSEAQLSRMRPYARRLKPRPPLRSRPSATEF